MPTISSRCMCSGLGTENNGFVRCITWKIVRGVNLRRGVDRDSVGRSIAFREATKPCTGLVRVRCVLRSGYHRLSRGKQVNAYRSHEIPMTFITDFETEFTKKLLSSEKSEDIANRTRLRRTFPDPFPLPKSSPKPTARYSQAPQFAFQGSLPSPAMEQC